MNFLSKPYFLLLILWGCTTPNKTTSSVPSVEKNKRGNYKEFVSLLDSLPNESQFSIGVIENGKVDFLGLKKQNNEIITIDNKDKTFEIGSISKVFTSLLFTKFIGKNEVTLNDKVQRFFDFPLNKGELGFDPNEVQLIHLANHTSGLPRLPIDLFFDKDIDRSNPYAHYTAEKLEKHLKTNFYRQSKAGEKNAYSNLGAGLLGYILEKKSNKPYNDLLEEFIFHELSMTSSSVISKDSSQLVKGLDDKGFVKNWDFQSLAGAGGIKSSTSDMMKFIKKNIETNDKDYLLMREKTFTISKKMDIGLGWHLLKHKGSQLLFHNGATGGYTSSMLIDLEKNKGIIILCNVSPTITLGELDRIALKWIKQK